MPEHQDRGAELIAGALAGELSTDEQKELDTLLKGDAALREELSTMSGMLPTLRDALPGRWREEEPSRGLREAVQQIPARTGDTHQDSATPAPGAPKRRLGRALAGAAACVAVGVGLTLGTQYIVNAPPQGPPGTYGAVEPVNFQDETTGVEIDGSLIAHTWGTETVLEIEGLQAGEPFVVVLIAEDGEQFQSGTFFGSDVPIDCRMNAAVMRDDVERLEIRAIDGETVTTAELPAAIDPEE